MHVRELAELGAIIAAHGPAFLQRSDLLTQRHIEQYWLAARCRHERWICELTGSRFKDPWPSIRLTIEEIFVSELLTRTWAAVAVSHDRKHQENSLSSVARSVMMGHVEARNRALRAMVDREQSPSDEGMELNRLRCLVERWTDLLLGYLIDEPDTADFAFDPSRAREFGSDLRLEKKNTRCDEVWELTFSSLRNALQRGLSPESPNADLNYRIAGAILACFRSDTFDANDDTPSLWMLRLDQIADDTQEMVDQMLKLDEAQMG